MIYAFLLCWPTCVWSLGTQGESTAGTSVETAYHWIEFDVEWREQEKRVSAKLALIRESDERFVIVCRKAVSGTLFKYWATPTGNVLYLPTESRVFVGKHGPAIRLFPRAPALQREQWLRLLLGAGPELEGLILRKEASWWALTSEQLGYELRWSERKRKMKDRIPQRLLEPTIPEGTERVTWRELDRLWQ